MSVEEIQFKLESFVNAGWKTMGRMELYNHGFSDSEIAKFHGASRTAVSRWRHRRGLKPNPSKWLRIPILNLTNFEKGFLVGVIEGEGTITIRRVKSSARTLKGFALQPIIEVSNTSKELIVKVKNMIKPKRSVRVAKKLESGKNFYTFTIQDQKTVLALLREIVNYLVSKRRRGELVKRFCEIRLKKRKYLQHTTRGERARFLNHPKNYYYGSEELEIYEEVKRLNG